MSRSKAICERPPLAAWRPRTAAIVAATEQRCFLLAVRNLRAVALGQPVAARTAFSSSAGITWALEEDRNAATSDAKSDASFIFVIVAADARVFVCLPCAERFARCTEFSADSVFSFVAAIIIALSAVDTASSSCRNCCALVVLRLAFATNTASSINPFSPFERLILALRSGAPSLRLAAAEEESEIASAAAEGGVPR